MSYGTVHTSNSIHDTAFLVVLVVNKRVVSFKYLSVIIETCCFSFFVFGNGPKISIATNSNGFDAGKS